MGEPDGGELFPWLVSEYLSSFFSKVFRKVHLLVFRVLPGAFVCKGSKGEIRLNISRCHHPHDRYRLHEKISLCKILEIS